MTRFCYSIALACLAFPLGCWIGQAVAAGSTVTEAGVTLKSVSTDFPQSDREFPGGAAADVVAQNCTACHSPGMILTQPAMSRAAWQDEVNKMRTTYKAPIAPEDVPAIVSYLSDHKSVK